MSNSHYNTKYFNWIICAHQKTVNQTLFNIHFSGELISSPSGNYYLTNKSNLTPNIQIGLFKDEMDNMLEYEDLTEEIREKIKQDRRRAEKYLNYLEISD